MRVKKLDQQQRIVLNLDEAFSLQKILIALAEQVEQGDDSTGYGNEILKLNDKLDEALLKAESL